jgi:peptidyl-prolyl cis-trans isomerase B (cyclophilin B)
VLDVARVLQPHPQAARAQRLLGRGQSLQGPPATGCRVDDEGDVALHVGNGIDGRSWRDKSGQSLCFAAVLDHRSPLALLAVLGALALGLLVGCGSSDGGDDATQAQTRAETGPCKPLEAPAPKGEQRLRKPPGLLDPSKTWEVTFTTNCGSFTVRLDTTRAPKTAASFASLAKKGFYDDLTFHRIATGFVIQGGDPTGSGSGGPGYTITERPPRGLKYWHGIVAMAKAPTEPDGASGSQFFVVTAQDAQLPPQYALVGRIVRGLEVVDTIGVLPLADPSSQDGEPAEPVVIETATLRSR